MEKVTLNVGLSESVSGPAQKAAAALKQIDANAQKAQSALQGKFAGQWEKIGLAASKAQIKHQQSFASSWEKIGLSAAKAQHRQQQAFAASWAKVGMAAAKAQKDAHEKAIDRSLLSGIGEGFGFGKLASASFVGTVFAEGALKIGEGMIEAAHKVVEIISEGFSKAIEEGGKLETLRLGYRLSLGSAGGKSALADIDRFAGKTGYNGDEIARLLLPLRRAGFNQNSARTTFAMAGDIAAGNGRAGDLGFLGGVLDTFTNIKLKGGVTRKQLAGLGVDTVDFYKRLGQKLKVSQAVAETRAEAGKGTDPQLILNTIGEAIEKQQGGKLGTGTEAYGKTLEGRLHKLKQLPNDYFKAVADSPEWNKLSDKLGSVLESLSPDSLRGHKIITSLMNAFDQIVQSIDRILTPENIDAFASGLDKAVRLAGALASAIMPVINGILRLTDAYSFTDKLKEMGGGNTSAGVSKLLEGNLQGSDAFKAQDEAWSKVRQAEGVGWWQNLNLQPEEKQAIIDRSQREGRVSPMVAQAARGGFSQTNNINVMVQASAGEDPTHTAQKTAQEIGKHVVTQVERVRQEAGL